MKIPNETSEFDLSPVLEEPIDKNEGCLESFKNDVNTIKRFCFQLSLYRLSFHLDL